MSLFKNRKYLLIIIVILLAIAVPVTLFLLQQQQDIRQRAATATTLTYSPTTSSSSPLQVHQNDSFTVDMMVNPGANAVSVIRYEITYDATKVGIDTSSPAFVQNTSAFPTTLEGPIYTPGKISGTVSIGSDYTKAITQPTTIATLRFKALATTGLTPTQISYAATTQVLSVGSQDQASENVLSSTTPAFIEVLPQATSCSFTPTSSDIMIIDDISGSTSDNRASQKAAMIDFVDGIAANNTSSILYRIGLISYASVAKLNFSLQNGTDYAGLKNAINTMPAIDNASAGEDEAITMASQQFQSFGRSGVRKSIVMLTDRWDSYAQNAADAEYAINKSAYYILAYDISNSTIRRMLQTQASSTGGTYHEYIHNSTASITESGVLTSISNDIACPTVTPAVSPINTPTPTNTPIPTPTSTPKPSPTNTPIPTPTRTPTPTATPVPTSTPVPTATPIPLATKFSFSILMHGIGHSGDNPNPTAFSLSNQQPVHPQRTLTIEVFNSLGTSILNKTGLVTYNSANGNFTGVIDMGTSLTSGSYNVKIKAPQYLKRQVTGIQTIIAGQTVLIPTTTLVTGDVNGDNKLNILDYDIIVGCYSDFAPPVACSGTQNNDSDLTDDGKVNQFDYNLFLRDLSVQNGD